MQECQIALARRFIEERDRKYDQSRVPSRMLRIGEQDAFRDATRGTTAPVEPYGRLELNRYFAYGVLERMPGLLSGAHEIRSILFRTNGQSHFLILGYSTLWITKGGLMGQTRDRGEAQRARSAPCPDFDLAPLSTFPPEVFQRNDELHAFVLSLALAYNDLKDISWMMRQLDRCQQEGSVPTPELGQWAGMRIFVNRRTFAILNEVVVAFQRQRPLLERSAIAACVKRFPPHAKKAWKTVIAAAEERSTSGLWNSLVQVRNNVVSHYYRPKALMGAYWDVFSESPKNEFNRYAYASLGTSMKKTRFYFVDVAPERYYQKVGSGSLFEEAKRYVGEVNIALLWIVQEFLRYRSKELRKKA